MSTVLHKDETGFAIVTSAVDEDEFRAEFSQALASLIESGEYPSDWRHHLEGWLAPASEIVCKLRGYKAQVQERRTIIAGHLDPDEAVAEVGREVLGRPEVAVA